jgi:hypothetical protein
MSSLPYSQPYDSGTHQAPRHSSGIELPLTLPRRPLGKLSVQLVSDSEKLTVKKQAVER